ncbi:MAG TPA: xanthine dehydrogenase family protein molybdopterin-binding subunit [Chloroflexota bacterium]|nr:xanthine dehydrogenase family protein molybdopterin-binding subunit [Chloroflexota bacterium]
MATAPMIGRWIRREDGAPKVMGSTVYTGDLTFPGMLHARLVLSPHPHARITSIDTEAARALPGVAAVYTAADLPLTRPDQPSRSRQPLATDRVQFDGHPVAIVLAESEEAADDAVGLVTVAYEELDVAVDAQAALAESRPLIHPREESTGVREDAGGHTSLGGGAEHLEQPPNAAAAQRYRRGDVEAGFAEADVVVERTYRTPWVHQSYMEPQSSLAVPDPSGRLTVYTSTQGAYATRSEVAVALGIPQHMVNVVTMEVGGGFGAKYALIDPLVAAAAWKVKRPVRLVYTRNDEFLAANPAPATVIKVKTGARRDGTLTALQAHIVVDTGLYNGGHGGIVAALLGGTYRFPNLLIDAYDVFTNKPGAGAYRAPGAPQACFAIEGQMSEMAQQLGLDPLEFRLQNAVEEGDTFPDGRPWPVVGSRRVLETLRDHPAWRDRDKKGPGEGVGIAFGAWLGATEPATALCRLNDDGSLTVVVGSSDISGTKTGFSLIAADAFGVELDQISVATADTSTAPYAGGSGGSKITYTVGAAVAQAAAEARRQVLAIAADRLEVSPEDLDIVDKRVEVRGAPGRGLSLEEIASLSMSFGQKYEPVFGRGRVAPKSGAPAFIAHLARVRVDQETGEVRVLDYVAVQDVGRAINPAGVVDQICGGVAQGIGWALYEGIVHDAEGRVQTGTLMDYTLPNAPKVPPITPVMVEVPSPEGPYGARGVGEPPIIAGAAAIADAIADATGVRLTQIPMTPERVLEALRER